jgi:hypothetical protein
VVVLEVELVVVEAVLEAEVVLLGAGAAAMSAS